MKTRPSYLLAATLFIAALSSVNVTAQEYVAPQVVISKEKVRSGGKIYYSHVVLERQTIYSISKAYGVTMEEIYDANPALKLETEGLKKDQILLIPYKGDIQNKEDIQDKGDIQTPPQPDNHEENVTEDYFTHKVKWYEDLDDIAKKYKVSKESIMNINRMTSDKVKRKQVIKIPRDPSAWEGGAVAEEHTPEETPQVIGFNENHEAENVDQEEDDDDVSLENIFVREGRHNVNISLLIPFSSPKSGDRTSFMDFYCGALLAARDIGQNGTNLDIHTYDIGGGNMPVTRERLSDSDFTIGPVSKNDIAKAARLSDGEAWIVSPLDMQAESLTDSLSKIIQAPTSTLIQIRDMVQWIKSDLNHGDKVLVVTPSNPESEYKNMVLSQMAAEGLSPTTTTLGSMKQHMTSQGVNRIVLACDYTERSTVFLIEALRNLYMASGRNGSIILYSTSRIRTFDQIEVEQLHKVNLHASVTYFVDYNSKNVKDFLLRYRALYNAEPSRSAYSGYDLMMYFSSLASKYGQKWPKALHKMDFNGLQSDFNLERTPSGSYVNRAVRRVVYNPDFSVTMVR